MPDEFKNFGQSLVATSLYSNNILLGMTSGYWDLSSEFKPLLHTWSLGVEEQFYIIVPVLLMMCWRIGKVSIVYLLWAIFIGSFLFALWFVDVSPKWAFFMPLTRAWEISIGALAAIYLRRYASSISEFKYSNYCSLLGIVLIATSILLLDKSIASPGGFLLIPTAGAVLIIIFCQPDSYSFKLLGNKLVVFLGLLSYSLYLWHQPVFAFLRAYSIKTPSPLIFLAFIFLVFVLSYLTWRFIESPFRNKAIVSRKLILWFSTFGSLFFIVVGLYLNKSYGMAWRVFDNGVVIADMDKRIYNETAFNYKKEKFSTISGNKILIIGNSFARDFTNLTLENFDVSRSEIVYRNDLAECIEENLSVPAASLFSDADVIVFASGSYDKNCYLKDIAFARRHQKGIFYIGAKDFGYNLNWLIRLNKEHRKNQFNSIEDRIILADNDMSKAIGNDHFISLLAPVLVGNNIPITDDLGRMLSTDREHLTKYGALFFGKNAVAGSRYAKLFN